MIKCKLCNKECKGLQALSNHLGLTHKINTKELKKQYYDTYMIRDNEGFCLKCGKPTHFQSLNKGYTMYCCKSCQVSAQGNGANIDHNEMWKIRREKIHQYEIAHNCTHIKTLKIKFNNNVTQAIIDLNIPIIKVSKMYQYIDNMYIPKIIDYINTQNQLKNMQILNKSIKKQTVKNTNKTIKKSHKIIKNSFNNPKQTQETKNYNAEQFEKENNCTQIGKLIHQYGQGWLSLKLPKLTNKSRSFISNEYLPIIQEYASTNHRQRSSKKERELYKEIKSICKFDMRANIRSILPHYELDIYIPELKLAFEYNGIKWHSIENGMSKDYHLKKSLLCREKGIRLVHIYESENFKEQVKLAKDLVIGNDNYNKYDFNKNNLIKNIPEPEIIYKSKHYTVFGAGKLY